MKAASFGTSNWQQEQNPKVGNQPIEPLEALTNPYTLKPNWLGAPNNDEF